ncbi:preprotein translocase subunit SecG [Aquirhabdus parva]|uniref:Protein-export membrane protein SecG n=1 Tax=Aquirhabdus parva TaxID=2283318 RepID=A0A345PAM9_9GAMM|nr:preprotein translocase subunit SecG [Aquirhabdus parva]AXI04338.1 preprotein translocase subunit SecG [Aquirhabdus parva]
METLVLILHILVALGMIGLILLQQGKGAEAGASFGAGASNTVFGASGSANFLTKSTAVLTTIFFITSLSLAIFAKRHAESLFSLPTPATNSAPAPVSTPTPTTISTKTPSNS